MSDEFLRQMALDYATRLGSAYSPEEVLEVAQKYYAFMKAGTKEMK